MPFPRPTDPPTATQNTLTDPGRVRGRNFVISESHLPMPNSRAPVARYPPTGTCPPIRRTGCPRFFRRPQSKSIGTHVMVVLINLPISFLIAKPNRDRGTPRWLQISLIPKWECDIKMIRVSRRWGMIRPRGSQIIINVVSSNNGSNVTLLYQRITFKKIILIGPHHTNLIQIYPHKPLKL